MISNQIRCSHLMFVDGNFLQKLFLLVVVVVVVVDSIEIIFAEMWCYAITQIDMP